MVSPGLPILAARLDHSPEQIAAPPSAGLSLGVPARDAAHPEISIVIPAMNERLTIEDFIRWCHQGLARAGIAGEILIVDSSTDETPDLALAAGARVLKTPKRGLGRAYIDAIPFIRGKYVLMGDADCTYDFREISGFVREFRAGREFIMGSRFRGYIEPGAMPRLHRYFGTPLTTWILNRIYSTRFSDIHCGMRGITRDALVRIELESQSWEYASEMVLKSVCLHLETAEVPVRFLKDRAGRLSHLKRGGWMEPWQAGWINLRAMLVYRADFFLLKPGALLLSLGLLLTAPLALGPVSIGPVTFSLYWMLLGLTLSLAGLQGLLLGAVAQVVYDYSRTATRRWLGWFRYTRAIFSSAALMACGGLLCAPLVSAYLEQGLSLPGRLGYRSHLAVLGLLLLVAGFMIFTFTLVVHAAAMRVKRWTGFG